MTGTDGTGSGSAAGSRLTVAVAIVGMAALVAGIGGILLTDASVTDVDSPYPLLLVVGLGCYLFVKSRDAR